MNKDAWEAVMVAIGAVVPAVIAATEWALAKWRHRRTLAAASSAPTAPRPLFGCFCDECQASSARLRLAREQAAAPKPLPPHVGSYRTNPRRRPTLPRKTPWWRLALWWARGGAERWRLRRRAIELTSQRLFPELWCEVCFARSSERCDPRRHQ